MKELTAVVLVVLLAGCESMKSEQATAPTTRENKVVLFDGKDLSKWAYKKDGSEANWKLMEDGSMQVAGGDIVTRDKYQDFKLHVEFWCPNTPETVKGQGRGNSGVY